MYFSTEVNSENINNFLSSADMAILYIKASWCGPCKILSPVVDEMASEPNNDLVIGKLDADSDMEFVKSLNVRNIPTLLFYKKGELVERTVGAKTKIEINKILETISQN
jgi:thioredoxin 1